MYSVVDPGKHKLVSRAENESNLELTTEANKVYFVKQEVTLGVTSGNQLVVLDEKEGRKALDKCKLSKNNSASN